MSTAAHMLRRGCARSAASNFAGALCAFERHLDAHPRDAAGWHAKSRALRRLGRRDEATAARECARSLTAKAMHVHSADCGAALLGKGVSAAPPWEPHPLVTFLVELALALCEGLV